MDIVSLLGINENRALPLVLVTRRLPASALKKLQSVCEVDLNRDHFGLSVNLLCERIKDKLGLLCLVNDVIDRQVIDAAPDLRVIATVAVGYDNIDVEYARNRGIVVTNTPDVLTTSVAEFTWGLILSIARRITEGDRLIRANQWTGWALDFMLGMELNGKRLGVIGYGRIGKAVAARAKAFGMNVVVTGSLSSGSKSENLLDKEDDNIRWVSLDELLVSSDVVSLHVPMNAKTKNLIDRRALTRMKRTAFLVNASRGSVVDENAVIWALEEKLIAGAALDVYESEPRVQKKLLSLENVVLSPHLGSATRETRTAMADLAVSNVIAVLGGEEPLTPVLS